MVVQFKAWANYYTTTPAATKNNAEFKSGQNRGSKQIGNQYKEAQCHPPKPENFKMRFSFE